MSQNANFQMILQDYENVTTQIEMETRWEIYLALRLIVLFRLVLVKSFVEPTLYAVELTL